jgi:hypothetical protein
MSADQPTPCGPTDEAAALSASVVAQYRYYSDEFGTQIKTQRTNVWIAGGFVLGIVLVAVIATLYLRKTGGAGTALEYMKLGPAALSSIALPFPLRTYLSYRIRVPIYRGYKTLFDEALLRRIEVAPDLIDDARNALRELHKSGS